MALQLFNTLTRKIETFEPTEPGSVSLYVCGMTPSFHPHLGHARTFLTFDILVRHLRAKGIEVNYIRNITDIDDRIIDRAAKDKVPWNDVVARYYGNSRRALKRLACSNLAALARNPRDARDQSLIERLGARSRVRDKRRRLFRGRPGSGLR